MLAAISAKKCNCDVTLIEKTDMLLGCGNAGGIMRNNGRYTATEEMIALGAGELFSLIDEIALHKNVEFPGHSHATLYPVNTIEAHVRRLVESFGIDVRTTTHICDIEYEKGHLISVIADSGERYTADAFVEAALPVINRRKSRAGKSFEHHLTALFDSNGLKYDAQAVTEGNKRPDFIFPSREAYLSPAFPTDRLATLAAKTTCKDRWRQILNEADRMRGRPKYLCTLQRGMSPAQMAEMAAEQVVLVVPKAYISDFPPAYRDRMMTIRGFISMIREMEGT